MDRKLPQFLGDQTRSVEQILLALHHLGTRLVEQVDGGQGIATRAGLHRQTSLFRQSGFDRLLRCSGWWRCLLRFELQRHAWNRFLADLDGTFLRRRGFPGLAAFADTGCHRTHPGREERSQTGGPGDCEFHRANEGDACGQDHRRRQGRGGDQQRAGPVEDCLEARGQPVAQNPARGKEALTAVGDVAVEQFDQGAERKPEHHVADTAAHGARRAGWAHHTPAHDPEYQGHQEGDGAEELQHGLGEGRTEPAEPVPPFPATRAL